MVINKDNSIFYVHNDHLNTPRKVTNTNNVVVFDWPAVDPFGANQPTINTIGFNIRYPGQYYDTETAYHYNYHRYYNPKTGKYLQADPIGLDGGYNLYNYVDNNSLIGVDPEGLWAQYVVAPAFGGILGAMVGGYLDGWNGAMKYGMQGAITGLSVVGVGKVVGAVVGEGALTQITANVVGSMSGEYFKQLAFDCKINNIDIMIAGTGGLLINSIALKPYTLNKQTVTSWAPDGVAPDISSGRWVMTGYNNFRNYRLSGIWKKDYPSNNYTTDVIEGSQLTYPSGWEFIKGLFGQRVIK